jgi:hypothetical protein
MYDETKKSMVKFYEIIDQHHDVPKSRKMNLILLIKKEESFTCKYDSESVII